MAAIPKIYQLNLSPVLATLACCTSLCLLYKSMLVVVSIVYSQMRRSKETFVICFCHIQARIAQLEAYRLGTGEVPGSNPGKGENFSVKISNWIVRI